MFEFIKEQALRKAQELKKRTGGNKSGLRPFSSTPYYSGTNRPVSGISSKSGLSELKMYGLLKNKGNFLIFIKA